jgi:hypothetical protein
LFRRQAFDRITVDAGDLSRLAVEHSAI